MRAGRRGSSAAAPAAGPQAPAGSLFFKSLGAETLEGRQPGGQGSRDSWGQQPGSESPPANGPSATAIFSPPPQAVGNSWGRCVKEFPQFTNKVSALFDIRIPLL